MEYALSHDKGGRIRVEVDGKFTTLPYMKGLNIGLAAYPVLSLYGVRLGDIKPVELSEIPEFPDRLIMGTPTEKHLDSQI